MQLDRRTAGLVVLSVLLVAGAPRAAALGPAAGLPAAVGALLPAQAGAIDCAHPEMRGLPMCAGPQGPRPAAAPPPPPPARAKGVAGGITAHLVTYNRGIYHYKFSDSGLDGDGTYFLRPSAGAISFFFESPPPPGPLRTFASIGGEMSLLFPKVQRTRIDGYATTCTDCKDDLALTLALIIKLRIFTRSRWVVPYVMVGGGLAVLVSRYESRDSEDWLGGLVALGVGVEAYPYRHLTPFFELRYWMMAVERDDAGVSLEHQLKLHLVTLGLGIRFY